MADDSVYFTIEEIETWKRRKIQSLCKDLGIKANQTNEAMIRDLKEYHAKHIAPKQKKAPQEEKPSSPPASPASKGTDETREITNKLKAIFLSEPKLHHVLTVSKTFYTIKMAFGDSWGAVNFVLPTRTTKFFSDLLNQLVGLFVVETTNGKLTATSLEETLAHLFSGQVLSVAISETRRAKEKFAANSNIEDAPYLGFAPLEVANLLKQMNASTDSDITLICLTAIVEYVMAEIFEGSAKKAIERTEREGDSEIVYLTCEDTQECLQHDEELGQHLKKYISNMTSPKLLDNATTEILSSILSRSGLKKKGATKEELLALEKTLQTKLPASLRALLQLHDGDPEKLGVETSSKIAKIWTKETLEVFSCVGAVPILVPSNSSVHFVHSDGAVIELDSKKEPSDYAVLAKDLSEYITHYLENTGTKSFNKTVKLSEFDPFLAQYLTESKS